jgi:hypothetical protein
VEEIRRKPPTCRKWSTLSHNVVFAYASPWSGYELTTLVMIGTDGIGSCKSNYHTITITTVLNYPFLEETSLSTLINPVTIICIVWTVSVIYIFNTNIFMKRNFTNYWIFFFLNIWVYRCTACVMIN